MTTGHFALAAGSKPAARTAPLWALMTATYLLDIVFMGLVSFGIESFAPLDPSNPAYGATVIHAAYSHSLVGAALIALAAALLAGRAWGRRAATAIGLVTFSHWLLDLIVHRADLPVLPGNLGHLPLLGFGLWAHPALSIALELALVVAGTVLYARGLARFAAKVPGRRFGAILAAVVTGALLALLLLADALALPMMLSVTLMLLLIGLSGWLDARLARRAGRRARRRAAPAASTAGPALATEARHDG